MHFLKMRQFKSLKIIDMNIIYFYDDKMKYLITFCVLLSPVLTYADTLYSCHKRHPLVYSSFMWTEVLQANDGQLHFQYGSGIDTQMIEVQFDSVVYQTGPEEFKSNEPGYELTVHVKNGLLDYTIISQGKKKTQKKFKCL